jgi:hypothetical protein
MGLAAEFEIFHQPLVAVRSFVREIIEKLTTTRDKAKQAAASGEIFLVNTEMVGEVLDTNCQFRDLDIGTSGVSFVKLKFSGGDGSVFAHFG